MFAPVAAKPFLESWLESCPSSRFSYVSFRFLGSDCFRKWTKAASSSTTSCQRGVSLAETEPCHYAYRANVARDSGGREHVHAHRLAARSGCGDGSPTPADISVKLKAKRSRAIDTIIGDLRTQITAEEACNQY